MQFHVYKYWMIIDVYLWKFSWAKKDKVSTQLSKIHRIKPMQSWKMLSIGALSLHILFETQAFSRLFLAYFFFFFFCTDTEHPTFFYQNQLLFGNKK